MQVFQHTCCPLCLHCACHVAHHEGSRLALFRQASRPVLTQSTDQVLQSTAHTRSPAPSPTARPRGSHLFPPRCACTVPGLQLVTGLVTCSCAQCRHYLLISSPLLTSIITFMRRHCSSCSTHQPGIARSSRALRRTGSSQQADEEHTPPAGKIHTLNVTLQPENAWSVSSGRVSDPSSTESCADARYLE